MPESLQDICRLCLSKDGLLLPIFYSHDSNVSFRYKILACADIEVFADDGLPSKVCHLCFHQVEKAFELRNKCEKSDAALRSQIQQVNEVQNGYGDDSCVPIEKCQYCFVCTKLCKSVSDLLRHIRIEHYNIESFYCNLCKVVFDSFAELSVHCNEKHVEVNHCDLCDKVFKHHHSLETHKKTHVQYNCKFCNQVLSVDQLKAHEAGHLSRMCQYCCKEFPSRDACTTHARACPQLYGCKFCDLGFSEKKHLIEHVNASHSVLVHKCNECQKDFLKWEDLNNHSCEVEVKETLTCQVCKMECCDTAQLQAHMSDHNNSVLSCKFCSKKFTVKSSLRRHEKCHSGQKPYQCRYCQRKFRDKSTCVVHMRTHTGEHPFQCQECNKPFKQLANLKMHTYRHHRKTKPETGVICPDHTQEYVPQGDPNQLYSAEVLMEEKVIQNEYSMDPARVYHVLDITVPDFDHTVNL